MMTDTWIHLLFAIGLGLILGSFFNACIYRMPREIPVWLGRSKCPHCQTVIPFYLNIPILSYLSLKGKSKCCQKPINPRYLIVEVLTPLLFALVFLKFTDPHQLTPAIIFVSWLVLISFIDIEHRIIPDELSLTGIVIGITNSLITQRITWYDSILGAVVGGGIFLFVAIAYEKLSKREGLGGGDVKMMAMLGSWFGLKGVFPIITLSTALGSIIGVFAILFFGKNGQTSLPFGPFLAIAALLYLFFQGAILNYFLPGLP